MPRRSGGGCATRRASCGAQNKPRKAVLSSHIAIRAGHLMDLRSAGRTAACIVRTYLLHLDCTCAFTEDSLEAVATYAGRSKGVDMHGVLPQRPALLLVAWQFGSSSAALEFSPHVAVGEDDAEAVPATLDVLRSALRAQCARIRWLC